MRAAGYTRLAGEGPSLDRARLRASCRCLERLAPGEDLPERVFAPSPEHRGQAVVLFDQLELWAGALKTIRA